MLMERLALVSPKVLVKAYWQLQMQIYSHQFISKVEEIIGR